MHLVTVAGGFLFNAHLTTIAFLPLSPLTNASITSCSQQNLVRYQTLTTTRFGGNSISCLVNISEGMFETKCTLPVWEQAALIHIVITTTEVLYNIPIQLIRQNLPVCCRNVLSPAKLQSPARTITHPLQARLKLPCHPDRIWAVSI